MTATSTVPEIACFMPSGGDDLLGVVTFPHVEPRRVGVIVLAGGRYEQSAGRNGVSHRLARSLSQLGFHVLRFDYHGVGDSTGVLNEFVLHKPFLGDLAAAVSELRRHGAERFVLMGDCFGSRTALAAVETVEDLSALVLVSLPWRDLARSNRKAHIASSQLSLGDYAKRGLSMRVLRNLADASSRMAYRQLAVAKLTQMARRVADRIAGMDVEPWVSRRVLRQLDEVRKRKVRTLMLYGTGAAEDYTHDFEHVRTSAALSWLSAPDGPVDVQVLDQPVAGFRNLVSQDEVVAKATAWIDGVFAPLAEVA